MTMITRITRDSNPMPTFITETSIYQYSRADQGHKILHQVNELVSLSWLSGLKSKFLFWSLKIKSRFCIKQTGPY